MYVYVHTYTHTHNRYTCVYIYTKSCWQDDCNCWIMIIMMLKKREPELTSVLPPPVLFSHWGNVPASLPSFLPPCVPSAGAFSQAAGAPVTWLTDWSIMVPSALETGLITESLIDIRQVKIELCRRWNVTGAAFSRRSRLYVSLWTFEVYLECRSLHIPIDKRELKEAKQNKELIHYS